MRFNGIKKDYIKVNMELFRPLTPPIEYESRPLVKGGDRVRKRRFASMELPVPITIKSDQPIEMLIEDMSNWLVHDEPKKLEFVDAPNRYYLARYNGMEYLKRNPYYAMGTIFFYLPEGYRFGKTNDLNIISTFQTFNILGQDKTPWTSKTTFTSSANQYILETNQGGKIILNYNFIAGDVLEIDYKKRKVTLNGNLLQTAISIYSHWFDLKPGQMQIRASHQTTLTYTERYY